MTSADSELSGRILGVVGAIYGVIVAILLTAIGIGMLENPLVGAIAGLFGGVGAFLSLPWLMCLNASESAEEDISYREIMDRAGVNFRLGVFGTGIKIGGFVILATGAASSDPNLIIGLAVGIIVVAGSASGLVLGRNGHQTRQFRSDHSNRTTGEAKHRRNHNEDRSVTAETEQKTARFRPETPGQAFGALFALSIGSLYLSLVGFVVYALMVAEENTTYTLADPPVAGLAGSWVGIVVSLLSYSIWSGWQLRKLPEDSDRPTVRNPVKLVAYVVLLFIANTDDLDAYDRRLRRTTVTFVLGVIALLAPLATQVGSPGRQAV